MAQATSRSGGRFADQVRRGVRVRHREGVRGARDVDDPARLGALGHVALDRRRDVAVLFAEHEPGGVRAPQRMLARRLEQRLARDRSLRGGHPAGLRLRGRPRRTARGSLSRAIVRSVVPSSRDVSSSASPSVLPGNMRAERERALPRLRRERGHVHQAGDLGRVGGHVGDDGAAVGVADEQHRPVDGAHHVGDGLRVGGEPAQRVRGGDDPVVVLLEHVDDPVPAGRLGERPVHQHDRGLHVTVPSVAIAVLADWTAQPALSVTPGVPAAATGGWTGDRPCGQVRVRGGECPP